MQHTVLLVYLSKPPKTTNFIIFIVYLLEGRVEGVWCLIHHLHEWISTFGNWYELLLFRKHLRAFDWWRKFSKFSSALRLMFSMQGHLKRGRVRGMRCKIYTTNFIVCSTRLFYTLSQLLLLMNNSPLFDVINIYRIFNFFLIRLSDWAVLNAFKTLITLRKRSGRTFVESLRCLWRNESGNNKTGFAGEAQRQVFKDGRSIHLKNVNLWAVYLCLRISMLLIFEHAPQQCGRCQVQRSQQKAQLTMLKLIEMHNVMEFLLFPSSSCSFCLLKINILLCRIRCLLFMVHEESRSKNNPLRVTKVNEGERKHNQRFHSWKNVSFLGSRTRRGFFLWFQWLGDMTSDERFFHRRKENFHKKC